jgi:uncharacterized protein
MITISIFVKTGASRDSIEKGNNGELTVRIRARPIKGAANKYLLTFLARAFELRHNEVHLEKGPTSRFKRVSFDITEQEFAERLTSVLKKSIP